MECRVECPCWTSHRWIVLPIIIVERNFRRVYQGTRNHSLEMQRFESETTTSNRRPYHWHTTVGRPTRLGSLLGHVSVCRWVPQGGFISQSVVPRDAGSLRHGACRYSPNSRDFFYVTTRLGHAVLHVGASPECRTDIIDTVPVGTSSSFFWVWVWRMAV